jgi:glutamate---cysteine ligase / carboxylate-amine ligase
MREPSFTVGVEEEYLLVDRGSRDLIAKLPAGMLETCRDAAQGQLVSPEFLRSQLEVGTRVCRTLPEVREALASLRRAVIQISAEHDIAPIAVSTHPFAEWTQQKYTARHRYVLLSRQMQATARRLLICGMHVHVGIEDDELRIDLLNQASYFLPHLLALTCSSPFWEGKDTGLKCYRLTVFDALPRTGIPERFSSWAEYERHIKILQDAGIIDDATTIWWDLRPSGRYPTLEARIMDMCTDIDDAMAVAALYVCILRMLYRLRRRNQRWRTYSPMLINENRWRAMRYSFDEGLIDLGRGEIVPFAELMDELLTMLHEDAQALGCEHEIGHVPTILQRGTSAHRQLAAFRSALKETGSAEQAQLAVVDHLITETAAGITN